MGKVLDNQCPSCKAPIVFNPKLGLFKCDYCGGEFTADQVRDMEKAEKVLQEEIKKNPRVTKDDKYVTYNCPDCGAQVIADENTAATFCVYCGNTSIIKNRLTGKFAPSKLIPFKFEKDDAVQAFKGLRKGRPFMPKLFNDEKNIEKITGVYIPFWLFEVSTGGAIEASGTKVQTWTRGDTHYTKTDYYELIREGSMKFHRIPVDGSTRFDNDIMNTIEPFDYSKLVNYNHAYLAGFLAEKYDVEDSEAFADAEARAKESARRVFTNDMVGFGAVVEKSNTIAATKDNVEYVLLPVYMVNVKYKDKYYLFAMNAESGEFVGNIPLDKGKVVLWTVMIFAISAVIMFLINYLIYLGAD